MQPSPAYQERGDWMSAADIVSVPRVGLAQPKHRMSALTRRQLSWGFFFLLPWIIGLLAFQLLPILFTFFLSFTDYKGNSEFALGNFNFTGLDNYQRLLSDPVALPA